MKKNQKTRLSIVIGFLLLAFSCSAGNVQWTYFVEEGEDATSSFYYFYQSNGESIQRVRMVWNGGAQNPPSIIDYLLDSGKIIIRHLVGTREMIPDLIAGKDVRLELQREYSISKGSSDDMLLPSPPDKALTKEQRHDLGNLIDLLAKDRKIIPAMESK
ncbi:MAG: hypothetical protein V4733_01200 [Verrucomicrobiota bacterium]